MALDHAQMFDVIELRLDRADRGMAISHSLLRTDRLQVLQLVLAAGQGLPEHRVPGEITIQCLAGEVQVETPGRAGRLAAGQMMGLPAGEPHAVLAQADAVLLVTLLRAGHSDEADGAGAR